MVLGATESRNASGRRLRVAGSTFAAINRNRSYHRLMLIVKGIGDRQPVVGIKEEEIEYENGTCGTVNECTYHRSNSDKMICRTRYSSLFENVRFGLIPPSKS